MADDVTYYEALRELMDEGEPARPVETPSNEQGASSRPSDRDMRVCAGAVAGKQVRPTTVPTSLDQFG